MIKEEIKKRRLVLDGAMGTMIQRYTLEEKDFRNAALENHPSPLFGNNDLLSITRPDIISAIHKEYLAAGADIIETNTFSSTTIAQADYGLESVVDELNIKSAQIAKQAAAEYSTPEKPRFVAGSIGPTNRTASISPDVNNPGFRAVSFDDLRVAYYQQAKGLIEGGVDVFLVETIFDTLNAKAALMAIAEVNEDLNTSIPIMVSGTITDASGRTLSGQTVGAFYISLSNHPILSIGFNCALGAKQLIPYLKDLNQISKFALSAHPNAGLPNEFGEYDQNPREMLLEVAPFMELENMRIIGGCCGTTPAHIAEIANYVSTLN
ncbi:MAG: 5-methyltetrahydrofolate--homocysteine methyltransferase [Luteibaculaceae bacterium]|jgi:5-methyltetrahydrofolate--homocysteine methyltransferase